MNRELVFDYVKKKYKVLPEYKWAQDPRFAVLQHGDNKKWFALVMDIPKEKIGLDGEELIDILNVKCEPDMVGVLRMTRGILPAYHMNKTHWVSILLDGSVAQETVCSLIDGSYELTCNKKRKSNRSLSGIIDC